MMKYVQIKVKKDGAGQTNYFLELDENLNEVRKVEQFSNGNWGYAELAIPKGATIDPSIGNHPYIKEYGGTVLGDQSWEGTFDSPETHQNSYWHSQYSFQWISRDQFQEIWNQAQKTG